MTAKYGIYNLFSLPTRGGYPPLVLSGGGGSGPPFPPPPLVGTLNLILYNVTLCQDVHHKKMKTVLLNYADPFFMTADILNKIFDHIPLFSIYKKYPVLDQNLS